MAAKVYFTTIGPNGEVKTRGSVSDYGFTWAAWYKGKKYSGRDANGNPTWTEVWFQSFSATKQGALKNVGNDPKAFLSPVFKSDRKGNKLEAGE